MMNKLKFLLTTFLTCNAAISPVFGDDNIAANTARMQATDKITGRVSEIDVPVNGLANFGTFSILVRKCVTSSPEETPENIAFVDIVDNYATANPVNIFKGWMFSSSPALNAVEHPIYDIWLLKCYNRPQERTKLLTKEQLALRDTIAMRRTEPLLSKEQNSLDGKDLLNIEDISTPSEDEKFVSEPLPEDSNFETTPDEFVFEDDIAAELQNVPDLPVESLNTQEETPSPSTPEAPAE